MRLSPLRPVLQRSQHIESGRVYLRPLKQSDWSDWAALREESRAPIGRQFGYLASRHVAFVWRT